MELHTGIRARRPGGVRLLVALLAMVLAALVTAPGASAAYQFLLAWGTYGSAPGQFNNPLGVAVGPAGNVYVADLHNSRIQVFTPTGGFIRSMGDGWLYGPSGVAVDGAGYTYATQIWSNTVVKFDPAGTFVSQWSAAGPGQLYGPVAVAVDAAGAAVYVLDQGNRRVQKFTSDGTFLASWDAPAASWGIAVDPAGTTVYVTNNAWVDPDTGYTSGAIEKYRSDDGTHLGTITGLISPYGVAVDAAGKVYASDWWEVKVFSPSGVLLDRWGSWGSGDGQFDLPWGIAVDPSGNVYVADRLNHRIQKFGPGVANGAAGQLADLIASVAGLGGGSFSSQLSQAQASLAKGNTKAACGSLSAFANHVQAQSGKQLTAAQANALLAAATRIGALIGC